MPGHLEMLVVVGALVFELTLTPEALGARGGAVAAGRPAVADVEDAVAAGRPAVADVAEGT